MAAFDRDRIAADRSREAVRQARFAVGQRFHEQRQDRRSLFRQSVRNGFRQEIGFAFFFLSFSTYIANVNMHLEDLFIDPEYRGKGYGKALLRELAKIVKERGYGRFEWTCLDWNQPSKDFYNSLGAEEKNWDVFHFTGQALDDFVNEK